MLNRPLDTFRRAFLPLFGAVVLFASGLAQAEKPASPDRDLEAAAAFVSVLANQALDILRQTTESETEKRQAIFQEVLTEGFDLRAIGRLILGKHWRSATKDQRTEYLRLFPDYIIRTYSSMLGGYSDESIQIGRARPKGKADIEVYSRILRGEGPPVPVEWRVRMINKKYRVIDVKVEGVSMVITKRSEFDSVVKNKGFDGLLEALQPQT